MHVGADARLGRILAEDEAAAAEWARHQKLRHDPRVTRVGSFLRKTSLDEIPQLFNVLKGEMSLVGPRPITDAEVTRYGSDRDLYCRFKPGITGLWQVSGRSEICYHQRVALDTWYVKNWTLLRDVQILLRTIPALLRRKGAV
jgi:undecaprenyl-phosphate galactose phosphotransferase